MKAGAAVTLLLAVATGARAQAPADLGGYASSAQVQAEVAAMARELKSGRTFLYRPLVTGGAGATAALEYWTAPGRPAVHPHQAEYVVVIAGAGELISGGVLIEPRTVRPDLVDGERIEGGTTRPLAPGDVFIVPAGAPHVFGIKGRLVLLGIKLPQP